MFELLDFLIDSVNTMDYSEKELLKEKIKKIKTILDFDKLFNNVNISFTEKEYEIIKEGCIRILHNNPNYGPKAKIVLEAIVKEKVHPMIIVRNVCSYLVINDPSQ